MAEGDLNLATLWLPVAPETSKIGPAMEEAGKQAKDKFHQSTKDITKPISDELSKVGTKVGPAMEEVGKTVKDRFSQGARDIGEALHEKLAQAGVKAKDTFTNVGKSVSDTFTNAFRGADNLNSVLSRTQQSMDKVNTFTKQVGVDISGWSPAIAKSDGQLDATGEKLADAVTNATEFSNVFDGLPGKIGKIAGAVGRLGGEITLAIEGLKAAEPYIDAIDQKIRNSSDLGRFLQDHTPGDLSKSLADSLGADRVRAWMGRTFHYNPDDPFGNNPTQPSGPSGLEKFAEELQRRRAAYASEREVPYNFVGPLPPGTHRAPPPQNQPPVPGSRSFYGQWYGPDASDDSSSDTPTPSTRSSSGGGGGAGGRYSGSGLNIPSVSSKSDLHTAGSRIANLYAFAHSLVGTPYSQALRNDCSGMVAKLANVALGLAPEASFSTVNEGEWLFSHGFQPGMGGPGDLRIGWYDHGGGNFGHTAATLPGGEHAESGGSHGAFLIGPGAAGADNPEFEHHAYLHMGGGSSSGGLGGDSGPLGSKSDPVYVSSADSGSGSGGESNGPWESQGQQLGQGLVNGIAEMFGVDGSVFKGFGSGKGLMDFGAVKLGGGLLNWGMQLGQARMGAGSATAGAGMATGGDGASIPGLGMLTSLGGLIPHGAAISAGAVPAVGAGLSQDGGSSTTINVHGDVNSGFNVTQHGIQDGVGSWKEQFNAQPQRYAAQGIVPNAGGGPAL